MTPGSSTREPASSIALVAPTKSAFSRDRQHLSYTAIWCEQHEDILAERQDGRFDAYQIKTKDPDGGPWKMSDKGFQRAVATLTRLHQRFGRHIADMYI